MASLGLNAQTIPNASFESPGTFTNFPGYSASNGNADITGWTMNNRSQIGLNTVSGPFVNYGTAVPDGTWAAFIQSSNSASNTLSTTISGLTVGVTYTVTFSAGQRAGYTTPSSTWSLNGGSAVSFTVTSGVWTTFTGSFTATSTTAALSFNNTTSSDSALLLDNFKIIAPPTVTTPTSASSTGSTALLGGNVTSDGGSAVTERGVVYSGTMTNSNPVIGGTGVTKVTASGTTGVFTATTAALTAGAGYSYKAYATNSIGTTYSSVSTFTTSTLPAVSSGTLLLHLDAGMGVATSGSTVTSWTDQSPNGYVFNAGGTPQLVASAVGGHAVVRFDGSTSRLSSARTVQLFSTTSSGLTVFTTFKTTNNSGQKFLINHGNVSSATFELGYATGNGGTGNFGLHRGSSNAAVTASNTISNNTYYTMALQVLTSGTAPNNINIFQNGTTQTVSSDQSGWLSAGAYSTNATTMDIGVRNDTQSGTFNSYHAGDIASIIIYQGVLNSTDRQSIESALSGMGLPAAPAPTITSLNTSTGSTSGGTNVTITGTNFNGASAVTFGGAAATSFTVVNDTTITATTPSGGVGSVSVVVTTPNGSNASNSLFAYVDAPVITTPSSTSITAAGATLGGNVTSDNGAAVTERGVVYSVTTTNSNPTIGGGGVTKVIIAGTTGVFATGISGLTAGTGYSFKAYAINSVGTTYTTVSTFTTVTNTAPSFALQGQGASALSPGGWWRAENNTADSSGNGNDGTAVNGVTYTSGPSGYGQAFHMNGSGQYISVPHSSSVSFSSSFTIAAWVRVTDRNNFYFIATKQPSAGAGANYPGNFEFRIPPSGNVELMYQTGASSYQSFAATSQIPLNTWTHVAAVFSAGTSVSFYINGTAAGVNATGVTTLLTNTQPLLLGTRADNYTYFVGDLDEVSLFGSALSQAQVQGVYYSAVSVAEDSGAYSASGFASGISAGSAAESGQTVSFALSNNNNALFSAQPAISTSGTLTFTPAPNANGSATVTVTAMDNGGTASGGVDTSAAQTFTITVTPVNDTPTDIALTSTSIAENNAAGATVGTLSTTDVDAGDTFTYTLVSGTGSTDNASFTISGSSLKLTPSADYETKNSYAIRVRSTDAGGLFFEKQFTISITNVNEAPTNIALSATSIAENNAAGAAVGTLSSSDADAGDTFAYTLVSGTGSADNGSFSITGSTLKLTPSADYETKNSYSIRVRTTDAGSLFFEKQFTISITNVNEAPSLASVSKSGTEDTTVTFTAADFTGAFTDPDSDSLFSIKVTSLPATGTFMLSGSNVSTNQVISAANLGNLTYVPAANENGAKTFTVTASDGSLSSSPATTVTMTLAPVNDAPTLGSAAGGTWTARDSSRFWSAAAASSDGTKLVAAARFGDKLYTSTDSGSTWTARDSNRDWISVASSADGTKLVAANQSYPGGGLLYTSTDSGVTWTARSGAGTHVWLAVASSTDGTKLAAAAMGSQLYTSTDSGATWTARATTQNWFAVASSADGTKLAAAVQSGGLYTSTDSGTTWTLQAAAGTRDFKSIASSADGTKLVVAAAGDQLLTSTDSGVTWTLRDSARGWVSVASSADGVNLLACENGGQLYVSTDSGTTWTAQESDRGWNGVAMSADAGLMAGLPGGDNIYISQASPAPLTIAEDAGAQTVNLSGIGSGATDESQTLTVTATSSNTSIIPNPAVTYTSASTTGSLSFTPVANANGVATITVTVTDDATAGGAALSTSRTFTVTVTPVNDTPTDIALSGASIAENNVIGAAIGTLSTTDVDAGDTAAYTLVSGAGSTDNASFSITGSTLNIGVSANYEAKSSYSIRLRTTDSGGLFFEKQFTVSITDVNETPVITSNGGGSSATISLPENIAAVTTVQATDPEVPATQTLTFSKSGVDAALFTINSSTGALSFVNAPNYEVPVDAGADNVYNVTVTVTDSYSSPLSDSQDLAITITDVVEVQNDVSHSWTTLYGGVNSPATRRNGDGKAVVVQQDGSGNAVAVYATGFTTNAAGNKDIYTVCYNSATGAAVWEQIYNGTANNHDEGGALVLDGNGDVIITGYTTNASGNTDVITLKYAHADGSQLWKKIYAGAAGGADLGVSVAVDASNNVAVAGYGFSSATGYDVFSARYASDGTTVFEVLVDGGAGSTDTALSVAADSGGNLIVGGYRSRSGYGKDLLVLKLSAASGTSLWTWVVNGSSNTDDQAYAVAVDSSDAIFVAGSVRNTNYDLYVAKLKNDGTSLWSKQWNSSYDSSDAAYALALDSNDNVVLAGSSYTAPSVQDGYVAKYNGVSGALMWDYRYDDAQHGNDILRSVGVDEENKVIATGYTQNSSGNYDAVTVKLLGADGSPLWIQTYNGAANGNDEGRAVAVTATGQAYVAGYSTNSTGTTDFLMSSYSAAVPGTQNAQTITFANPGAQNAGTSLTLAASSDSGLPVRFTVISGPAQLDSSSNSLLNFSGAGDVTVRATQSGSATYAAATPVDQTFTVGKSSQTISFTLPGKLSSTVQWPLAGVSSSGMAVTYSIQDGPGSITGGVLSFSATTGTVTVRASQGGDARYSAAADVDVVVTVDSHSPVVIFNNITENWQDFYAGSGAGQGNDLVLQFSGNEAAAGFVGGYTTTSTGKDMYLAKYLKDGTLSWSTVSGTGGDDEALVVEVDGNGDLYAAGYVTTGTGQDIFVAKYNGGSGARIWSYTYNGAGNGNDVAVSLDLEGSSNVVVGGYAVGSGTSNDFYAAKLNQGTGSVVWASMQNRSGTTSDVPVKLVVGTDGGVVLAGATGSDAWTIKLASADGSRVWQQVYNYANKPDSVRGLAMDSANNVYIAALSQATNYDNYTAKYDATTGALIWGVRFNSSYNSSDNPWDVVVDENANVYVAGSSYRAAGRPDGMTLKYSGLDGALQWQSRFNLSTANAENLTITLDGIGNPVVAGYTTGSNGTTDVSLMKCDKDSGTNRWQTSFDAGLNKSDNVKRVKADPNGNVWMTGSTTSASGQLQFFITRHIPTL